MDAERWLAVLAAAGSIIFFGSFAVPIKLPWVLALDIDPVVFQAYKSLVCFSTSWLVLLCVKLKFTWWGLIGGAVWVVNGIAAIMAVRLAGIGSAQSLWSGLSIFISYFWGAYIFKEPIKSEFLAYLSLFIMAIGMAGVSLAAAGKLNWSSYAKSQPARLVTNEVDGTMEILIPADDRRLPDKDTQNFITGILCALFVGIFNGSLMVPLKYAHQDVVGIEYLVSFGIGSMAATLVLLVIYHVVRSYLGQPRLCFHLGKGAIPPLMAGSLWSAGNFCSLYATIYLGMALGWPLVQCQILISAAWAVFYFEEVRGTKAAIALIFCSAVVVAGAVMLFGFGTVG